jgi:hypothetical protein
MTGAMPAPALHRPQDGVPQVQVSSLPLRFSREALSGDAVFASETKSRRRRASIW